MCAVSASWSYSQTGALRTDGADAFELTGSALQAPVSSDRPFRFNCSVAEATPFKALWHALVKCFSGGMSHFNTGLLPNVNEHAALRVYNRLVKSLSPNIAYKACGAELWPARPG